MSGNTGTSEPPYLRSRRNPLIARLRQLHGATGRREQGLLLLEGTHLLQECLRLSLRPQLVMATPPWMEDHADLLAALPAGVKVQAASEEVLEAASSTRHPDGVVLTLQPPKPPVGSADPHFVLALDRLQDPGNLGTMLRTALAAGVEQVWLGEGADPFQPKVLRASSGAALAIPLERMSDDGLRARLEDARRGGAQLVAAMRSNPLDPEVIPYWRLNWARPTVLLLGNEGAGLSSALVALADQRVTIPHSAAVESLNVAVAAGPLLLERWRQVHGGQGGAP